MAPRLDPNCVSCRFPLTDEEFDRLSFSKEARRKPTGRPTKDPRPEATRELKIYGRCKRCEVSELTWK